MTTQARAQVVVVLTAGWQVLCYDHNLRLMWSRRIKARQAGEGQMRGHALYGSAPIRLPVVPACRTLPRALQSLCSCGDAGEAGCAR